MDDKDIAEMIGKMASIKYMFSLIKEHDATPPSVRDALGDVIASLENLEKAVRKDGL